jgi:hypothetical protein
MRCWYCKYKAPKSDLFKHMWGSHHDEMIKKTRSERRPEGQPAELAKEPHRKGVECFLFRRSRVQTPSGHISAFTLLGFTHYG